jgi:hypothetical protein
VREKLRKEGQIETTNKSRTKPAVDGSENKTLSRPTKQPGIFVVFTMVTHVVGQQLGK